MGRVVIVAYQPRPGQAETLLALIRQHHPTLLTQGLVTPRRPITMQAADGTVIEVFEWASEAAMQAAHEDPVVLEMWDAFDAACHYVSPAEVPEMMNLFAQFTPLEWP